MNNYRCPLCGNEVTAKRKRCYKCTSKQRTGEHRQCEICNQVFYLQANEATEDRFNRGRFCSKTCCNEWKKSFSPNPTSKHITNHGYVRVFAPGHPRASRGRVFEHILVMEQHIGRYITRNEHVHHKDGNKANNDISNLELMTASEHLKMHWAQKKAKGTWHVNTNQGD